MVLKLVYKNLQCATIDRLTFYNSSTILKWDIDEREMKNTARNARRAWEAKEKKRKQRWF